ncbi:MAG: shikimate kinase [Chloroflexi bacterium]|nr:shikimate kinase [Chloroflexota bacterium]MBI4505161.1 shikimate kinase [Chloroflexota bacterium]
MGLSGSGKSTVGRLLAARLGWELVDTDAWIVAQTGRQVHEIFAQDGEPAFRAWERQAVAAACDAPRRVIALGGGAPLDPQSFALLRRTSALVWLRAAPETLAERLRTAEGEVRPLLAGDAPARLRALLAQRAPVYVLADLVVDTEAQPPEDVAAQIAAWLHGTSPAR